MANDEHVKILLSGVEAWNTWRVANPDARPDLDGADLSFANLNAADLSDANLSQADLVGANFSKANLSRANFSRADLSGASFSKAHFWDTLFQNVDLSKTFGLEDCNHYGPSTLDPRTLRSSRPLPLTFLRGCGLSDWEIEAAKLYQKGLTDEEVTDIGSRIIALNTGDAIQYHSCFISYSSADEAFCRKLHDRLQDTGIRTWFAPEDMRGGRKLFDQVERGIQLHDKLLLVLTEQSMQSEWVEFELHTALKREKDEGRNILFPLRLVDYPAIRAWRCPDAETGSDMARAVRKYHIPGDFEYWQDNAVFDAAFEKLLEDLRGEPQSD